MRIFFASLKNMIVEAVTELLKENDCYELCGTLEFLDDRDRLSECLPGDVIVFIDTGHGSSTANDIKRIRSLNNQASIVLISSRGDIYSLVSFLDYSIQAILTNESSVAELHTALQTASSGGQFFSSAMMDAARLHIVDLRSPTLTQREIQVVHFIAQGIKNKEIAKQLSLSEKTISAHKSNVKNRLNLRNTSEIVRYAIEHKLITPVCPYYLP